MKPTSPSHSGGGESRDIFNAEYTGLPGHHRVLKPPGGGSSDIFGVDASEPARVRNTNHLQSSMFGSMMETATPKTRTLRNPINHDGMTAADCTETHRVRSSRRADGNPVTGEGYAIANGVKEMAAAAPSSPVAAPAPVATTNGTKSPGPKTNGTANVSASAGQQSRGRVPPGGFSSGLW